MKELWRRIWATEPHIVDGVIAAFIIVTSLGNLIGQHVSGNHPATDIDVLAVLLVLVGGGAITFRRDRPIPVLAVVSICLYVFFARGYTTGSSFDLALYVAAGTVATYENERWYRTAVLSGIPLIPLAFLHTSGVYFGRAVSTSVVVAIVAVVSRNVRLRRENQVQVEITEQVTADKAVTDERLRIARELHDVVAHAMSVVTVQSGVAAHVIDTQPDEAKRMLENIRVTSHEALDEMRRLLGVLRGSADLAPAPGLRDIDELAESLRESGVPVTVTSTGDSTGVPAGVDLTAYRIVQEALTNVLKHAGPASAHVAVDYAPGLVVVEIIDDGRGAGAAGSNGGHGQLGMRERVAVFGGDLIAGPRTGGGFRVRATLPYAT